MSYSGEFEGRLLVDGAVRSRGVSVWMSDTNLILSEPGMSRFEIILFPFNMGMMFTQTASEIEEGLYFDFHGNRLGAIKEGPLGHLGDGEYNRRAITGFRTVVSYLPDRIRVEINGKTTSGVHGLDDGKILAPATFSAQFEIPQARYVEFFQLPDHVDTYLRKVLAGVFG